MSLKNYLNSNNLYYASIYGQKLKKLTYLFQNIRDSFRPYIHFLDRAIEAEKEREISALFKIVKDDFTVSFKPITKKLKILSEGFLYCEVEQDWVQLLNFEDINNNYEEFDWSNCENFEISYMSDDGAKTIKISKKNIIVFEDDGKIDSIYLKFPMNYNDSYDFYYKRVRLQLEKVIEDLDLIEITHHEYALDVIDIEHADSQNSVVKIHYSGVITPDDIEHLRINGLPLQNPRFKQISDLGDVSKIFIENNTGKRQLQILRKDFKKNCVFVEYFREKGDYSIFGEDQEQNRIEVKELRFEPIKKIQFLNRDIETLFSPQLINENRRGLNEYAVDIKPLPKNGEKVRADNGNEYECIINKKKKRTELKLKLLEENEEDMHEISEKSPLDYFFEDDVNEVMGHKIFEIAKNKKLIWTIIRKNREERTISIKISSKKNYKNVKYNLERMSEKNYPLYLNRNVYQLKMERNFINRLMKKPLDDYLPLLRLGESIKATKYEWDIFNPLDEKKIEWEILTENEREGTEKQRLFVEKALNTPDFAFLEGPPGSGKTTAIIELIFQLIKQNKKILLAASTHVAIDNVLERIKKYKTEWFNRILPLRIGDRHNISSKIVEFQIDNLLKTHKNGLDGLNSLILDASNLVCGTTIGILKHPWFDRKKNRNVDRKVFPMFDYLIIDESSKTTFQDFIIPALYAKRWILVGDIKQLAPYAENDYLKRYFEKLTDYNNKNIFNSHAQKANYLIFLLLRRFCDKSSKKFSKKLKFSERICFPTDESTIKAFLEEINKRYEQDISKDQILSQKFPIITIIVKDRTALANVNPKIIEITESDLKTNIQKSLLLVASDLILIDWDIYNRKENIIPPHFFVLNHPNWKNSQQAFRWRYIIDINKNKNNNSKLLIENFERINQDLSEKNWASEISWRLIRSYELRALPDNETLKRYYNDLSFLLPRKDDISRFIINAWSISLPSILESLQSGIGEKYRGHIETILKTGFPNELFFQRHVKLEYQFRMHRDISKFPRKEFYDSKALQDSKLTDRTWQYFRYRRNRTYESRFTWIDLYWKAKRNRNEKEANRLIKELKEFLKWAESNPMNNEGENWTVACITFYKGQERLIREKLRQLTGLTNRTNIFYYGNVDILLYTVDKIQGREADIIFLSLVRNARFYNGKYQGGNLGFMDNPNRLNVALTRAKYQLVILGHILNFQDQNNSIHLKNLTKAVTIEKRETPNRRQNRENWINSKSNQRKNQQFIPFSEKSRRKRKNSKKNHSKINKNTRNQWRRR
ncbi:MAG: AAA domain-containing protein [Candidatus Lokiarchaeota archaeon]|nr:AAA domain-containing protein [Candidatus Harpocratesius repetitus]